MIEEKVVNEVELESSTPPRNLTGFFLWIFRILAISMSLWQIYVLTAYPMDIFQMRSIHVGFTLILSFMLFRPGKHSTDKINFIDIFLCFIVLLTTIYAIVDFEGIIQRAGVDPTFWDVVLGTCLLVLVLELTRRATGLPLVIIALLFIGYVLFGQYLPAGLRHGGYSYQRFISYLFSTEGLYGLPIGVSSTYIFMFILFGSFLSASGAGITFTELAKAIAGAARGGPAKIAVIASSLFGTISGSAVANVMVDGWMTIPLMKSVGYRARMAAAVEAVASTGGQIMPPVMGSGAFIMAEILGVSYTKIIIAAAIPAILYYLCLYWMIDFEALRFNLRGLSRSELPKVREVMVRGGHLMIPLVVLLYALIVLEKSPINSAFWAIISIVLTSFIRRETRMGWRKIFGALEDGPRSILGVAITCACAGIIVGVLALTGLGVKLSSSIIALSQGYLILALFLTMIVAFILGMGLPTVAAYIICASTAVPALAELGVAPLAAHMFVFYFACLSAITPPVALAAFAAAGIARAGLWEVGLTSVKICAAGYIIPYMFIYGPSLLMIGDWTEIIYNFVTACIGATCLAAGIQGWAIKTIRWSQRILLIIAALALIKPGVMTDIIGICCIVVVILLVKAGYYKKEVALSTGT